MKARWSIQSLGDLCDVLDSKRKPITKKDRIAGEFPYYGATGILDHVKDYIFDEELVLIGEDGAKWGAGENTAFLARGKYWVNNHAHVIRPKRDVVLDEWLISYLNFADLTKYITGLTVPKLNQAKMREIVIPVAPLKEQQRIVAILNEAFAGIATATANAEKNLQNARELFESTLQSVFAEKGEGWVKKELGETCKVERGSSPRPIKQYLTDNEDGVNWIKIGDTKGVNKYIIKTKEKITVEGAKKSRLVEEGDFILTNSMSYGRPYIMKTSGYIHDGWFVLRLNEEIDADYFYYLLISPTVKAQFEALAAGAIVKNISSDLVKKAVIPIPPLSVQKRISREIEKLAEKTHQLEEIYMRKLVMLENLKQSILQKAFAGELH